MKHIVLLFLLAISVGCGPPDGPKEYAEPSSYVKEGETLIHCKSPIVYPENILFYESDRIVNDMEIPESAQYFQSYYVTDVLGDVYALNSDEFANYSCIKIDK